MERVLSQDERIRRAEEIYARRRMQTINRTSATVNVENSNNNKLTRKLIIQSIICLVIYACFYGIKNIQNIVPAEVMYKIADILEYDINIEEWYGHFSNYINKKVELQPETENIPLTEETLSATDDNSGVEQLNTTSEADEQKNEEGNENVEETNENSIDTSNLSQMEIDAQYIKENCSIRKPLYGEITSRFGHRNPTVSTVPKYHTGIDIARVTGTVIVAAMDGTVELVSSQGDYGNHVKITNGEVSTLYAHCSKIYVAEGSQITQGQEIAEVGATGNVTGPHLHFEIRRNDRYVDPDLILDF